VDRPARARRGLMDVAHHVQQAGRVWRSKAIVRMSSMVPSPGLIEKSLSTIRAAHNRPEAYFARGLAFCPE
jgi:hypothetical protein